MTKKRIFLYIISFVTVTMILLFVYHFRDKIGKVITPFFMALIISYLLHPLVIKFEGQKVKRTTSILLIYLVFSILAATITVFIVPELVRNTRDLINTLPEITSKYQSILNKYMSVIRSSSWPPEVKNAIFREMQNGSSTAQEYIINSLKKSLTAFIRTMTAMMDLILAMIIAYYFIKDSEFFKTSALSLVPRRWRNGIIGTGKEINGVLSNFIQGQLLTALIIGTLETTGLFIVHVKYPLVLGVIGGIANIIPYFGPIIGAIPAVAVALIESPVKAAWTVLVFVIVQQIDNAFISPKIIEGRLGLHPVTTILAVLVGGEFFGIIGMLIAVPMTAILKIIIKRSIEAIV